MRVPAPGRLVVALDTVDVVSAAAVVDDTGAAMSFESDPQAAVSAIAMASIIGTGATSSRRLCTPVAIATPYPPGRMPRAYATVAIERHGRLVPNVGRDSPTTPGRKGSDSAAASARLEHADGTVLPKLFVGQASDSSSGVGLADLGPAE